MFTIKKIKAPIGDENKSLILRTHLYSSIKKIKAPIGDENTKLIFPQSHTHFQIKKIKAPIGDENPYSSCSNIKISID